jgi:hypothetical protein
MRTAFWCEDLKIVDLLTNLGINGRIILKEILKK